MGQRHAKEAVRTHEKWLFRPFAALEPLPGGAHSERRIMLCPRCHRGYDDTRRFCTEDGAALVVPPENPSPYVVVKPTRELGAVIDGRWVVCGFLGQGGMARVYLAEDAKTKARVAVKILGREHAGDRVTRERFLREIDVAAEIGHPNIAKVLDAGHREDGSPFLVIELLVGESVGERLRREEILSEAFTLSVVRQVASALSAAHGAGIIHRDVKPDNVFLVDDPSGEPRAKVMDFGMAKLREGPVTQTGLTLGTLPYMAPEQALADPLDGRTDVYALGVMMYRMLTGDLPFDTPSDPLLVAQHLYVAPRSPRLLRPELDPRIEALILTAMRKVPGNRYASMSDLLEDVERLLGMRKGEPAGAPMRIEPDVYEPLNPLSKTTARFLRGLV
jgi:eukaryotic-like serine/threonine-protein kinase